MSVISDLISYYTDLLIIQYKNKPKALATIEAMVTPSVMDLLPIDVENAFDIDTAVGAQLDILGQYIGADRLIYTFTGPKELDDDDYRTLIKIKRGLNNIGSSFSEIQDFIFYSASNILTAFDHADMSMSFYINSNFASLDLAQSLIANDGLPKPMGVSYSVIFYLPQVTDVFGFRTYTRTFADIIGFNYYDSYNEAYPFISYQDTLDIP